MIWKLSKIFFYSKRSLILRSIDSGSLSQVTILMTLPSRSMRNFVKFQAIGATVFEAAKRHAEWQRRNL